MTVKMPKTLLLATAFALCVSSTAQAEQRAMVNVTTYPWSTVARVGYGHGWCSAVLIGPSLAATAAHCLWNKTTHRQMKPQALNVVVGYDRGIPIDGSYVTGVTLPENWVPEETDHYGQEQAGRDWALLELEKPLGTIVGWVALSDAIKPGVPVAAAGYGTGISAVVAADTACHMKGHKSTGAWTYDCDTVPGDSGGPVFSWDGNAPRVVAVNVARFGGREGGAVAAADFIAQARKLGAPNENNAVKLIESHQ